MQYSILGKTGLRVSRISLGTVELGQDYGIRESGKPNLPTRKEAIDLLEYGVTNGINFFDTAPGYGVSEELLGAAIGSRKDCYIATKVTVPLLKEGALTLKQIEKEINNSIDSSLSRLRRDVLDIVQIHNATSEIIKNGVVAEALFKNRASGKIRFTGATVYGEEAALSVIKSNSFDILQVAYSLLDQRMDKQVFPLAKISGIGVVNRSVLLKGALSPRVNWLPDELGRLKQGVKKITGFLGVSLEELPQAACCFCLSNESVHTVLVGASNKQEIDNAVSASSRRYFEAKQLKALSSFGLEDENLLNPSYWAIA